MTTPLARRWPGYMRLGFVAQSNGRTVLSEREHRGPLLVQRPLYPEGPGICHVAILHPPSGLAGGDELDMDIQVASAAHATLSTPGATRWYKANGEWARQRVSLHVQAGGMLDWLPQENIFFEQAQACSQIRIRLESGARTIGWEISQLGSVVAHPHWADGVVRTELSLQVDEQLLWVDQGQFAASDPVRSSISGLDGLPVFASLWCFGDPLEPQDFDELAASLPWHEHLRAGVTTIKHNERQSLCLLRCTGLHAEDVRKLMARTWLYLRPRALGVSGQPLRLWTT